MTENLSCGISALATYIPRRRISVNDVISTWENCYEELLGSQLLLAERAVPNADEDAVTMAFEAADALFRQRPGLETALCGLKFGSCTKPYVANPSSTILAAMLGTGPDLRADDVQFSTMSGAIALADCQAHAIATGGTYLAIGSDVLSTHVAAGSIQEYSASAGAAAALVEMAPSDRLVVSFGEQSRHVSDLADSFRLDGQRYIRSGGPGAVESGAGTIRHTERAVRAHLAKTGNSAQSYDFVLFQQPVGVIPIALGQRLGFDMSQIIAGVIAYEIGDTGSASSLISLAMILEQAQPGQKILFTAYGFGAGALVMDMTVEEGVHHYKSQENLVSRQLSDKTEIGYAEAMKLESKLEGADYALSAWS